MTTALLQSGPQHPAGSGAAIPLTEGTMASLTAYTGVLPYSSEPFAICQPLLGWLSCRTKSRYANRVAQLCGGLAAPVFAGSLPTEPVFEHDPKTLQIKSA